MQSDHIRIRKEYSKSDSPYIEIVDDNGKLTLHKVAILIRQIKKHFAKYPNYVVYSRGYCFDGLNETNKMLLTKGCVICELYPARNAKKAYPTYTL